MNRSKAIQTVEGFLKNKFRYLYKKEKLNLFETHLTFQMDSSTHELQTSMDFQEAWIDILTFISPTILKGESPAYWQSLQTINYINWYIKGAGRFYIDSYGDLAYSLRMSYDFLENEPNMAIKEIETGIDYFSDLFNILLDVCSGKQTFDYARNFIDMMWREKCE